MQLVRERPSSRRRPPEAALVPVLQVLGVSVAYGAKHVLRDVSLAIDRGEIVALLGPNGAGKSTLSRAICGQIGVSAGTVRVMGSDPLRSEKAKRSIGLVPQDIALYDRLTPRENLAAFGAIMGVARKERLRRSEALLERVGLGDRMNDPVRSLSGGMQRRVNIAVALMHDPALLVLDEPTVGLDAHSQAGVVELLRSLRADGTAVLLVTHDLAEAQLVSDRLAIIVKGRIRMSGSLNDLVQRDFADVRLVRIKNPRFGRGGDVGGIMHSLALDPGEEAGVWQAVMSRRDPHLAHLLDLVAQGCLQADEVSVNQADLKWLLTSIVRRAESEE
jgi:ABC-2 type transport system ATP-binding protein